MASIVSGLVEQVQVLVDGQSINHAIASTAYGYCPIGAATSTKTVEMSGFTLINGVTIQVKFSETNTATNPTLNVQQTGDFPIMLYGSTPVGTTIGTGAWTDNEIVSLTYIEVDSTHKYWYLNKGNTKTIQSAVTDPTRGNTPTLDFIATISQDANGVISVTKQTISTASTSTYGVLKINDANSSATKPLYYDNGLLKTCDQYAGGTLLNLNGTSQPHTTASIYAPTGSGNSGELLISSGSNTAPAWSENGKYSSSGNNKGWIFKDRITINNDTLDSSYNLYVNGSAYINGAFKTSGDVTFSNANGNTIIWTTGSDQVRPSLIVSKTSPIFTFTLTSNGGTSTTSLLQISNSGDATFFGSITSTSGQFGNISIGTTDDKNVISSINSKDIIISPAANQVLAFQQTTGTSAATTRIILSGNTFYPPTTNTVSLGLANNRWLDIYTEDLIVIGNGSASTLSNPNRALRIYATTNYTDIKSQANGNHTFYLPYYNNNMYAVHAGSNSQVGGASTPVYVAENGRVTASNSTVGSQYAPIYLNAGTFNAAYPVQYLPWSFSNAGDNRILFQDSLFTSSTYVISIVVTSGEQNLNGPITWETNTTSSTGRLILTTNPGVSGQVSGYLIIALGADLSSIQGISSDTSNT